MKTEETIYQSEGTQILNKHKAQTEKEVATPSVVSIDDSNEEVATWKKVVIGGVAGIALGTGAVFAVNKSGLIDPFINNLGLGEDTSDVTEDVEGLEETNGDDVVAEAYVGTTFSVDSELQVADLGGNLSFSEAFAEARSQVGPGGVFEWNGSVYGTYYADEWDNMSDEDKVEFGSHISYASQKVDTELYADNIEVEVEQDVMVADADVEVEVEVYHDIDSEVQVLGVTEEYLADGSVATVGHVEIEGQEVFLIDTNQDGHFNVALTDSDQDGIVADNEYINLDDGSLSVDSFDATSIDDQYLASNEPDYTNDDFTLV